MSLRFIGLLHNVEQLSILIGYFNGIFNININGIEGRVWGLHGGMYRYGIVEWEGCDNGKWE